MKKWLFFIPAIIFTLFYGLAALSGIGSIQPVVITWLALFWISGSLLSKAVFWGGILGTIPAICFIYMGTQDTGQVLSEMPIGIIILFYYIVCTYYIYKKGILKNH